MNLPADAGVTRDMGSIPESGRSPREGNGNLLQYSYMEIFMDRGTWWAIVAWGHKESDRTEHTHTYMHTYIRIIFMLFSNMVFKRFLSTIASFNF